MAIIERTDHQQKRAADSIQKFAGVASSLQLTGQCRHVSKPEAGEITARKEQVK